MIVNAIPLFFNSEFSMSNPVNWSQLPEELWPMIGKRLKNNIDVLRFRSICKSWRSSALAVSPRFPRRIVTPFGEFSLTRSTIYRLEPSNLAKTLSASSDSSSSKGWLIKVREPEYGHLYLLDPFTNIGLSSFRMRYPSDSFPMVLSLLNTRFVELLSSYSFVYDGTTNDRIRLRREKGKVVLFPSFGWAELENCLLFSVYQEGKLGFSRISDDNNQWSLVDVENFYYDDIIVHKGQVYVVDRWGTISWIDCSSLKLVQFSPPLCGLGKKKHLVECDGSLYVVDMFFEGEPNHLMGTYSEVIDVKVYELDEEWGRWLNVKNLGERVFVLGKDCNFSLIAPDYRGCEENCIYFEHRGSASMFCLESSTFKSPKVFWPCPSLFDS